MDLKVEILATNSAELHSSVCNKQSIQPKFVIFTM